ncbi:prolyl oligopeptidase family serine peptidase [Aureliella helgolandensis]|uniref:Prolyl oligopeptidase family protein n=1 Tax=Aureliella helgolandensis TaxID=2527968 RepID=A0A518G0P3_9BACT|nr:prolyl oligopeptidase family serine peptidase [Aureliella helgolandensis]QDV22169.1 Prolyl oligopeptidase family protein [Aureliella helgolandensis]
MLTLVRSTLLPLAPWLILLAGHAFADGPADNNPQTVRPVPAIGIDVSDDDRARILARCTAIERELGSSSIPAKLHPLIAVFPRAVRMTLDTNMIYSPRELEQTNALLAEAERRLAAAKMGASLQLLLGIQDSPQPEPQLVVAGYASRIDGSIQPYGLVLPSQFQLSHLRQSSANPSPSNSSPALRLDVWLHGRGERVSESSFLSQRLGSAGEYTPADTIVLHPYGRYCNAFKFAGEIDVIEALEHVQTLFAIDQQKLAIRGFSMGGAGCWQLAVHYPNLWAAANPGAGFSETTEFLRVFQDEEFKPTPYQQQLLHWYDCPDWTNNLRHVPTIAYSGEIDRQKQAADVMAAAFAKQGMELPHVIGPQMGHKIDGDSKVLIEAFLAEKLATGKSPTPRKIDLTTYSLRYNRVGWMEITGLGQHWTEARVQGTWDDQGIHLTTNNVTHLTLHLPLGQLSSDATTLTVEIDEQILSLPIDASTANSDKREQEIWPVALSLQSETWSIDETPAAAATALRKRPGLQGPIDDAFMDRFVFVPPQADTALAAEKGTPSKVDQWVAQEYRHATGEWKRHFRGDIVEVQAQDVDAALMADSHLVLFGTPQTNPLIAQLLPQIPIEWTEQVVRGNGEEYSAAECVPVLIYPNPLNPTRYIVLNSGFTYREFAYLNNARQIPMLPDWAIVDIREGATSQYPGKILDAGFFSEDWQWK